MPNKLAFLATFLLAFTASRVFAAAPVVPQALAWSPEGRLIVGARDGTLLEFRPSDWTETKRTRLPSGVAGLLVTKSGKLVVGGEDGVVYILDGDHRLTQKASIGRGPVNVATLRDESLVAVSRWGRMAVNLDPESVRARRVFRIDAPLGKVVGLPDGRAVVFDAFGDGLHRIDPSRPDEIDSFHLEAVNILGAALSGDRREILFGHMSQYSPSAITKTNIDWGLILSSRLSSIRLSELASASRSAKIRRRGVALDGSKHGAADPSAVAVSSDGKLVAVSASGSNQVLLVDRTLGPKDYSSPELPLGNSLHIDVVGVGRSPADVAFDPTGRLIITADAMSDTLSVIDVASKKVIRSISLGESPPTLSAADRGERLFRDGRKAFDSWMSCASCHVAGHTNGLNYDTSADGGYGAAKNTPSLLGSADTAPYSWLGKFGTLEEQVRSSMETTLHGSAADAGEVADLAQYLRALAPPASKLSADEPAVLRGSKLFLERKCDSCHRAPTYQTPALRDVGIHDDAGGYRKFNPPSLRGAGWTAPYFHDGRAKTLLEALQTHHPRTSTPPSESEARDLKSFLESL